MMVYGRKLGWREAWLLALIPGLILPRAYILLKSRSVLIDSDEAIIGLMARHILHGHLPIWLYGISYMGSIEAFTTAGLFGLFGATPLVLKLGPFCWFCAFLYAHYLLALEVASPLTARLSTLLLAVSPAFLSLWSLVVVAPYMSTLCLGTFALLIATRTVTSGISTRRAALLGIIMGLAWWTNLLSITYIAPIVLILLLRFRKLLPSNGLVLAGSFLLGSLPFWLYNVTHKFSSLRIREQVPHGSASPGTALSGFLRRAVPILLGTRPAHGTADFFRFGSVVGLLIFLAALVGIVRMLFDSRMYSAPNGRLLLMAVMGWTVILFAASGFGYNADEPRYLIPLYSVFYLMLLASFARKYQLMLAGVILVVNLTGTLHPAATLATPLNAEPNDELVAFLHENHVHTAYAPYWVAYRLTFESKEELICTPPPTSSRYDPYLDIVRSDPAHAFIQLDPAKYPRSFQQAIEPPLDYSLSRIGNYEVFLPP